MEWFSKADMLGGRRQCKLGILKAAIEKYEDEDGGPDAKNPLSVDFFRKYWKSAQMLAPELGMRDEPKDGGFLYFHPANLPKYLKLMHRIREGMSTFSSLAWQKAATNYGWLSQKSCLLTSMFEPKIHVFVELELALLHQIKGAHRRYWFTTVTAPT